jgi:hypothetical protein
MSILFAVLVTTALMPTGTAVPANEPPLPDAGLDQTVERGATVFLDGTGSRDPDGTIPESDYDWTIRDMATNRTVATLVGPTPSFTPPDVGRYAVTLAVTDDDGATRTDTLYVTVRPGEGPNVSVSGPDAPQVGTVARYTARLSAGTANLSHVTWRLDGTVVANRSVDSATKLDRFRKAFPTAGERDLTVTLVDDDGLSATSRLTVDPQRSDGDEPSTDPIASGQDPTVLGPQLVTGAEPLDASYSLELDAPDRVASVEWQDAGGVRDSGRSSTVTWQPGVHDYYAVVTYTDGSSSVAKFADGTTSVVADPKPDVSLGSLTTVGGIAGTTTATDAFDNLDSLIVRVDGSVVARWPDGRLPPGANKGVHSLDFDAPGLAPNSSHQLKIVATDRRGQRGVLTRTVTPDGVPRVISSGFVNTPVDSYHERIDASRYAGHHVIRIALNGVSREKIEWSLAPQNTTTVSEINSGAYSRHTEYDKTRDVLTLHSYWSAETPRNYAVKSRVQYRLGSSLRSVSEKRDDLNVTPSDPELRLNVTFDGTPHQKTRWGIVIDASRSFDPDGTELRYIWLDGARPITPDNTTAKFYARDLAGVVIEDRFHQRTSRNGQFHEYYAPEIRKINYSQEPILTPSETIEIPVQTSSYSFSHATYNIDLETEVRHSDAHIKNWHKEKDNTTSNAEIYRHWEGTLVIEVSEFVDGNEQPVVIVRNSQKPEQTVRRRTVPAPTVVQKVSSARRNVTVSNLRYQVRRPQIRTIEAQQRERRDYFLSKGYSVTDTQTTGTEYSVQRYTKVQKAKYEEKRTAFQRSSTRRQFLDRSPSWNAAGTETKTEEVSVARHEWRDQMGGRGHFTGGTREVLTDPAEYRTEREYEYTTTEERTGTRTVTEYKTVTTTETRTRTVMECNRWIGCYEKEETYTVEVEETISYEVTERYTYTVEETHQYWAVDQRAWHHHTTGDTREIKVDDAEYETQYRFQYTDTERRETTRYLAETTVQTQEEKYGWQHHLTTKDKGFAEKLVISDDYRIGSTSTTKAWELTKQAGERKVITKSYDDESDVLETRANVEGDLHRRALDPRTGEFVRLNSTQFSLDYTSGAAETRAEIIHNVTTDESEQCGGMTLGRCNGGGKI